MTTQDLAGLGHDELLRYSRHLLLPEIGVAGQRALRDARVLVIGAGGLGSPALLYLAAAGIGTLGIVDFDTVDLSNLQRQVLHDAASVGESKTASAARRIAALNPGVAVERHEERLSSANALALFRRYDVVVDGTDNFPTRYLANDACVLTGRPLVYGAIYRFDGQASVFAAKGGPCYRCLYPEPPPPGMVPSCAEGGVLGALPGIIGSIQALEAIKLVTGAGTTLAGRLLLLDALDMRMRELTLRKDADCPVCGAAPTVIALIDYEAFCGVGAPEAAQGDITAEELRAQLGQGGPAPLFVDVRQPHEIALEPFEGALAIPLDQLPARLAEVDPRRAVVTVCQKGMRSRRAAELLRAAGHHEVRSLQGGVERWRDTTRGAAGGR